MKKIFILTELYFPEKTSTAYFLTEIAQGLAQNNQVSVITGNLMYETKSQPLPRYETIKSVDIVRCRATSFNKNNLLGRIINGCSRSISIFLKAFIKCHSSDIILVVTNPPLLPLMALLLKYVKGAQFILLVHDVYPEVLAVSGIAHPKTWIYRIFQWINKIVYRNACRIVTLGRDMSQIVYNKIPNKFIDKVICIPNWAETEIIYPIEKSFNPLLRQLNLLDKFVVLYAGNMGRTHDLQILISAAEILASEKSNFHFLFVGSGARKKWLENYIEDNHLDNVTVLSYFPYSEKNTVLNACDLGVISFMSGMSGVSVPSRMYNQMAAGKPILAITDRCSELAYVLEEEGIGWVVEPEDLDSFVKVLRQASEFPEYCIEMGQRASSVAKIKYTVSRSNSDYKCLFDELSALDLSS